MTDTTKIKLRILALIESCEPPRVMWDSEGKDYDTGYKEGYADAVAEVYRLIDGMEEE